MRQFAQGFSDKLFAIADFHRPPYSELTLEQVESLADLSGYNLVLHGRGKFTLYYFDHLLTTGFDDGVLVVWHAMVRDSELIYHPFVQPYYIRGNEAKLKVMEESLTYQLPHLGFTGELKVLMPEPALSLPDDLFPEELIRTMFISEFKQKYAKIFRYFQQIYEES